MPGMSADGYAEMTGREIRELCRRGAFDRPTCGVAMGYTQANLVILRRDDAAEFAEFCELNPKPCPLLEVTEVGSFQPKRMAPGADVRTDLPRYRVYVDHECVATPTDILAHWRDDCVAFLIGCSFTFEAALQAEGVPVRHIEEGRNVPMFRTHVACRPAGRFSGPLVVSMRPMTPEQASRAATITARFQHSHGAPVHVGDCHKLGITDLNRPDYGDAVTLRPGEVPVFWACGVTPTEAILHAKLDLAITHEPGHMFMTDVVEADPNA